MKLTNLGVKDLITPKARLTFLVGAGCSIDPPSCLPAGRTMMDAIINYTCAPSEIEKVKKLEDLRFEQLIEIIRDRLDPDLKIIDYYGLCDKPNLQHLFLAEMMKQGQFMLIVNFDFLIEYALRQSGVPKEEIKVVITKEDFKKFNDPQELYSNGIKALYKIHGSTKNVITGEPTRNSLIATIQAFGANKEGVNVFQLELFKQPAFTNLTKHRSLVVMGYSGSDDFDIVPTLKVLEHIQNIIWINHLHDDEGKELIYEIEKDDINNYETFNQKTDQILVEIKRMDFVKHIFRVDVNTTRMIKQLIPTQIETSHDAFSIYLPNWLLENITPPTKLTKMYIPFKIYDNFDLYGEAMAILEEVLTFAEDGQESGWKAGVLNDIGRILKIQGNYSEALKRFEEALQITEQFGDLKGKALSHNNIGQTFAAQGNYSEALKRYEKVLQIAEQLNDLSGKATSLNNIGVIFRAQGKYPEALKRFEMAFQIAEQLGDLSQKTTYLNNIGQIFKAQGNYSEALKRYEKVLQIAEQLNDLSGKATSLNNIGVIFRAQGKYPEALKLYEEALQIAEQLGYLNKKATYINDIGEIFRAQQNYSKALKQYQKALQIAERLGDLSGKATSLNNSGLIFREQGNYPEALKRYEEVLQIVEHLGDLEKIARCLNNIGEILKMQGNYPEALKRYKKALQIAEKLGDLSGKAIYNANIGAVYYQQENYFGALKYFEDSLNIFKQLNELPRVAICSEWIGNIYRKLNNTSRSLHNLERALEIYEKLGLEDRIQQVRNSLSKLKFN